MADSLNKIVKSPVTVKVLSDGTEIPGTVYVKSVVVSKSINKIASANIKIFDGGSADGDDFVSSDEGLFNPGKKIEIKAGYASEEETIFKGIVIRYGMKISSDGGFLLNIECKDEAVKLTIGRKNKLFTEKTDSDIIQEILSDYGDIAASVESTSYANPELIQNYATDWDFIMQRAELNGLVLFNSDNELNIKPPEVGSAVLNILPGDGLISFNAYTDARNQFNAVKAASWDRENQELLSEESSSASDSQGGNISLSDLADVVGLEAYNLQTTSSIPSEVLQQWAAAKHLKSSFSKIQGKLTVLGYSALKVGDTINISNLSDQFNGDLFVGGFEHVVEEGEFQNNY